MYWTQQWLKTPGKWRWTTLFQINQKLFQGQVKTALKTTHHSLQTSNSTICNILVYLMVSKCIVSKNQKYTMQGYMAKKIRAWDEFLSFKEKQILIFFLFQFQHLWSKGRKIWPNFLELNLKDRDNIQTINCFKCRKLLNYSK